MRRARRVDQTRETRGFSGGDLSAERSDGVVAAAFVVVAGADRTTNRRFHETGGNESSKRAVERARLELELAVASGFGFLNDRVAVPITLREGDQDLEFDGSKREVRRGVGGSHSTQLRARRT